MKRVQVITTVLLCALMICCKKKEAELPNGGILNISFFDSIGFPDSIRDVEGFSFTYNGNTYLCYYCPMLDSAEIEFNKHFIHNIQMVVEEEEEWLKNSSEATIRAWFSYCDSTYKETGHYPQQIIYESERDLDTIINKQHYTFTTSMNIHRDLTVLLE